MKNNKNLYSIKPFLGQKNYNINSSLRHPKCASLYNKMNLSNNPKKKNNNIYNNNKKNINNIYFDNLNEKVSNLYDLVDSIKLSHNKEINTLDINNSTPNQKYYINSSSRIPIYNYYNKKNINAQQKLYNELKIDNDSLTKILLNNALNKKIVHKKKNNYINNNTDKRELIKKNRNIINYITPNSNNFLQDCIFNSFSNYYSEYSENNDNILKKYNKIISNYKYFKDKNSYNLNYSPVGQFDNYFYNSTKLDKKKLLNNHILITNSKKDIKNINNQLTIESPTSLSYHSYIRRNSQREMSIEHNIEYDINNNNNQKNLYFNDNNFSNYKKNGIFNIKDIDIDKDNNRKLKTEISNSNIPQNCQTLHFEADPLLNFKKCKFKSATVSRLIKDFFFKKNENENFYDINLDKNKNKNDNDNDNEIGNTEKIMENKNNVLIDGNNAQNKIIINYNKKKKNNIKNIELAKKIQKLIKNKRKIIIESNKENCNQKILLKDKKEKKMNVIPFDRNIKKYYTIENINKKQKQNNIFSSKNLALTKNKINKKIKKENISSLGKSEKGINCRYIPLPEKSLTKEYNYNSLQTMENSNPKIVKSQSIINKKIINNNNSNNRNINKVFTNFIDTILNSKKEIRANTESYLD